MTEDQKIKRQKLEEETPNVPSSSGNNIVNATNAPVVLEEEDFEERDSHFTLSKKNFVLNSDKIIFPMNVPTKPDTNLRWIERIGTFYQPHASFVYEIIYQYTYKEPGFEYQWQYLPYSGHSLNRWMMYCVVSAVSPSFSNVVSIGDIVVKMNDESLLYKPGDKVDLKTIGTKLHDSLRTLKNPITLRFFRTSGHTNNTLPSPAELSAVTVDKGNMHRFLVKVNIRGDVSTVVLEASSTDPQAPLSIKKSLQGNRPQWQLIPNLPPAPLLANNQITQQTTFTNPTSSTTVSASSIDPPSKEGVVRDGKKWSVMVADYGSGSKVLYNLGSFEREEDANRLLAKVLQSSKISGKFNMRHYLLNFRAPSEIVQTTTAEPDSSVPIDYTSFLV